MPVEDEKKYLRSILRETRDSLAESFAKASSSRIQAAFLNSDLYRTSQGIVLYAALTNEVHTDRIFSDALASGRDVFYPRLDRRRDSLVICRVESPSDLEPGSYGIREPNTPSIEIGLLPQSVVIIPGVTFTMRGERIGRGGGHYDRLLAELPQHAITVGLAYSFQLLDQIPQAGWDRRLNFVVTETAIYPAREAVRRENGARAQGGHPRW